MARVDTPASTITLIMSELDIPWPCAPQKPCLEARAVHVWAVALDLAADRTAALARTLAPDERDRADKFRLSRGRERFIVARGSLRTLLGHYLQHDPAGLEFTYGSRGKPALAGAHAKLHFNLAHSDALALIAVTLAAPVGVDVERVRPTRDAEAIATRYFSAREAASLRAVSPAGRDAAFFRLWTRKEAWLKATGEGISESLARFEVSFLPEDPPRVVAINGDEAAAAHWSLHALNPVPGFVGALAIPVAQPRLECWRFPG